MSEKRDIKLFVQDVFDENVVWSAIKKNLPELKEIMLRIQGNLK